MTGDRSFEEDGGLDRIRHIHFERAKVRTRLLRLPVIRRRFPAGYEPYGGSAFWALSTPALEYVHRHVRDNPSFMKFFRHVLIPDEIATDRVRWIDVEDPEGLAVTTEVSGERLVMDAWVRGKRHATIDMTRL